MYFRLDFVHFNRISVPQILVNLSEIHIQTKHFIQCTCPFYNMFLHFSGLNVTVVLLAP